MKKTHRLAFWLIVLFVIVSSVLIIIGGGANQSYQVDAIGEGEWTKGNPDAKITLIEYSDFQCPACASYYPVLKALGSEFEQHVFFAYRHFPLRSIHDKADLTAQVAEAAGLQGKFWEMHDLIFATQKQWENITPEEAKAAFVQAAADLGLDIEKFTADLESQEVHDKVDEAYKHAEKIGLGGTPTIFLNGELLQKPASLESFRQVIRQKIEEI